MGKTRILIVEDELIVAKDIRNHLIRAGYEVPGIVAQGEAVLQQLETSLADIVLMDIALRGNMDGIEAARQIRDRFDIPVIYLTAHAAPETLERAGVTEPFGYLLKPFDEKELPVAIEMALYKHRMDKQLREREEWLSTVLTSIGDAVVVTDIQRRITFLNPMAEQLIGRTRDEVIGQPVTDSLHIRQDHIEFPLDTLLDQALHTNTRLEMPQRITLTGDDGSPIPIIGQAAPIQGKSGVPSGVVLTFHNISAQVKAEAERDEQHRMLLAILDTLPDLIIFKDQDLVLKMCNQSYCDYLGRDMADLVGTTDFDRLPPEQAQLYVDEDRQIIETGRTQTFIRLQDGPKGMRWEEAIKTPLKNEQGQIIGVLVATRDVTSRVKAEKERDKQQRMLQTLVDALPEFVIFKDRNFRYLFCNKTFRELHRVTEEELVGKNEYDLLEEKDARRFQEEDRVVVETGRTITSRHLTETRKGAIWTESIKVPIRDERGEIIGIVVSARDLTDRLQLEAERDEQRRMLRALLDTTPDIVIFKDQDSKYRAVSERHRQLMAPHIPMPDFLGKTDFDIFPEEEARRYRDEELQVMETGKILKVEHPLHTVEGLRWFEAVKMPLRDEAGNMIGVFTSERDITDRLQAESERDEQRRMLRAVLDTLPDFIIFKDTNSVFRVCNKAFCDFVGLPEEEIIGKADVDIFPIDEALRYREEELEVMQTENTVVNIHLLQGPAGVRWDEAIKTPLRDERGEIIGVLIAGRDITARVQAEEALARRAQEMTALYETSLEINAQQDVSTLLQDIVRRAAELVGAHMGGLYLMTSDEQQLRLMVSHNLPMDGTGITLQLGEGLAGQVAQLGKPMSVEDYSNWHHRAAVFANAQLRRVLAVPLKVGSRIIGTLNVADADRSDPFDEGDIRLVSLFADQAAIAVENARLLSEHMAHERKIEQRNRELTILYETLRAAGSSLDPKEVFRRVAQTLADAGGYRFVSTYMQEDGKLQACERIGYLDEYPKSIDPSIGVLGRLLRTGEPQFIVDGSQDPDFVATSHHLTSEICVPIKLDGEVVGVLNIETNDPENPLTGNDFDLMMALADQLKLVVYNARLYQDLDAQRKRVEHFNEQLLALQQVSVAVTSHLGLPKLLDFVALSAAALLGGDSASIFLFAEDKTLTIHGSCGLRPATVRNTRHKLGQSITGIVAQTGEPLIVDDVANDPRFDNVHAMEEKFLSMISTPLMLGKDIIGTLNVHNSHVKHAFDIGHLHILSLLAHQAAVAIETANLYQSTAESESRYRELFERNLDGLVLVSAEDGQIVDANPAFQEMLGYSLNELKQRKIWEIRAPEHREAAQRCWAQYQTQRVERGRSIPYQTKNGRVIETEFSTWLMETSGRHTFVTSVRDVTDRLKLEEHLRQAQKMEAIGTLAGGIAHDFNNILGSILGYASFVKDSLPPDDPARTDVEVIERSARRGADLTHQLLAFAQGGRYETRPIDLNAQVKEVVQLLARTLDKSIAIRPILDSKTAPIAGDAGQINQLLLNLCINAAEAMPAGGFLTIETKTLYLDAETARRELGKDEPGSYTLLTVSDTGHGIEPDILKRIFEPFFSTKKGQIGKKHGGLGLATVFGIVKGHNGAIQVESQVGQGTTFKVWLPASQHPVIEEQRIASSEAAKGIETVLVVDDEESLRSMLNRILSKAGYQVLLASTGMEALEIFRNREKQVDLVILDMIMPEMSGLATFRRLKELTPNVHVLLSSGYSDQGQAQEALTEGALGFIQKPFSFQDILSKVRTTLDEG